jgi:hypothetical protein
VNAAHVPTHLARMLRCATAHLPNSAVCAPICDRISTLRCGDRIALVMLLVIAALVASLAFGRRTLRPYSFSLVANFTQIVHTLIVRRYEFSELSANNPRRMARSMVYWGFRSVKLFRE